MSFCHRTKNDDTSSYEPSKVSISEENQKSAVSVVAVGLLLRVHLYEHVLLVCQKRQTFLSLEKHLSCILIEAF